MSDRRSTLIFSFWAWLILAPPLITVWGGYGNTLEGSDRLHGLVAAIIVHLLLGLCFWLAALVERRLTNQWRWIWFIAILVVLSVLRPLLADFLQDVSGLHHLAPPAFLLRVALNVIGLGGLMLIVYFALERVERAAANRLRLDAVLQRTEQQRTATEVRIAALVVDFQRTIADPIRRAIAGVDAKAPPAEVADALMDVANGVVRPLSERTFAMDDAAIEYHYRTPDGTPAGGRGRLLAPPRIEASMPFGPVAIWLFLQLPMTLLAHGTPLGFLLPIASTGVVLVFTWLVRMHPLPSSVPLAITLLALEYAAIGAVGTLTIVAPSPTTFSGDYWVYGVLVYAVAGTILSIGRSTRLDFLASEDQLVTTLIVAKRRANVALVQLATTTNLLARRLHAGIQADVVAAALQIRLGSVEPGPAVAALTAHIERVLAAPMAPSEVDDDEDPRRISAEAIRSATEAAVEAWQEALDLTARFDPALWAWIASRPEHRVLFREVETRGLTNIIRYARGTRATLTVDLIEDHMRIEIRHPGRIVPRDHRVSGLGAIHPFAKQAELVQEDGEVVYRVSA